MVVEGRTDTAYNEPNSEGSCPAKSDKDSANGRLAVPFILIFSLCALDSIRVILRIFVTGSYM